MNSSTGTADKNNSDLVDQCTICKCMIQLFKLNKKYCKSQNILNIIISSTNSIIVFNKRWVRWLKRLGAWLRAGRPGFDPGCRRGGDFSSLLRVQTGPGVHSTSYKISTGDFHGGKGGRA